VSLHRVFAEKERAGQLFVGLTGGHEAQDLRFT
jgi:hypothetical protein